MAGPRSTSTAGRAAGSDGVATDGDSTPRSIGSSDSISAAGGQSAPLAIDHLESLDSNTTQALIADLEALREHLGVDAWVLHGVSWGCALAIAYALEHRQRVKALVLTAVTAGSRDEIEWITDGVGRVFPEAWGAAACRRTRRRAHGGRLRPSAS